MNYVGIDIHKKYSVACVQDEKGHIIRRERIEGNRVEGFQRCLNGEWARAVIEASWNWTKIYDILEGLEGLEEVVLANPLSGVQDCGLYLMLKAITCRTSTTTTVSRATFAC